MYVNASWRINYFPIDLQNADTDKKEKDKGSASPFDGSKDDNGPQGNGLASQNGLDDDKGFKWVSALSIAGNFSLNHSFVVHFYHTFFLLFVT